MTQDPRSPFNWKQDKRPSIFAQDVHFRPRASNKTAGQAATEVLDARRAAGPDPSTIYGLGAHTKEKELAMLAYKQFGIYSKAGPSLKKPNKHEAP